MTLIMVLSFPTDIRAVKFAILSALKLELCGCGGGCGGRRGVVVEVGGGCLPAGQCCGAARRTQRV